VSEQNNGKQAEEPKAIDQAPVKQALDMIRPYLQADGGDVELVSVEPEGVVKVRLVGACGGCPMSQMTLSAGIERILKQQVPAVKRVVAV
jgi:Fe-S cluster biogenesis protein NfuA